MRTALVTGANRGIGLAASIALREAGLRVVATSRSPRDGYELLDVDSTESVEACSARLGAAGIDVDVLVNNAGIELDTAPILGLDDDTLRRTLETNLLGPLRTARAFLPGMIERGYGRIVNVSSGAGSLTEPSTYAPAYGLSKSGLNALTRRLALAVPAGVDVKVNAYCPGWVRTDMGGPCAPLSAEESVVGLVRLATLPADGPTNGLFRGLGPAAW